MDGMMQRSISRHCGPRPAIHVRLPQALHLLALLLAGLMGFCALPAQAERLRELASIQGIRQNQLLGYGLVVGLDGTGDQTPFTTQSTINMLQQFGVSLPTGINLQSKNVAGVVVTASMGAFAQPGQTLDITVSSLGNSKSLRGGTLLMTPSSITGTSINTPTTVASAAPEWKPNKLMAAATANSKKLDAPISADGQAMLCFSPTTRFNP